jgi:carbon storage regulator
MLVLTRKLGERIRIGHAIEVTVLKIGSGKVKLGFSGPPDIPIQRQELVTHPEAATEEELRLTDWLDNLLSSPADSPLYNNRPTP